MITWPYVLRAGHVDDPAGGACAMDAVNWLIHGKHGDAPVCASPVIGKFVIAGNDAMPDDVRQRLIPYLHRIAGSRSAAHEAVRLRILVLDAARVVAANAVEEAGGDFLPLRSLADDASYDEILKVTVAAASSVATRSVEASWVVKAVREAVRAAKASWAAEEEAAKAEEAAAALWMVKAVREAVKAAKASCAATAEASWASQVAGKIAESKAKEASWAASWAVSAPPWNDYFVLLDAVLNAGPQGEPWSADVTEAGVRAFQTAGGRAPVLELRGA